MRRKFLVIVLMALIFAFSNAFIAKAQEVETVPVDVIHDEAHLYMRVVQPQVLVCELYMNFLAQPEAFQVQISLYGNGLLVRTQQISIPSTATSRSNGYAFNVPCTAESIEFSIDPDNEVVELDETNNLGSIDRWSGRLPWAVEGLAMGISVTQSDYPPGLHEVDYFVDSRYVKSVVLTSSELFMSYPESCTKITDFRLSCDGGGTFSTTVLFDGKQPTTHFYMDVVYANENVRAWEWIEADPYFPECEGDLFRTGNPYTDEWICKETSQPPTAEEEVEQPSGGRVLIPFASKDD